MATNTSECQPLIKLKNPFCEYYGIKLDKYVHLDALDQEKFNRLLWSYQEYYKWSTTSASTECLYQARFLACHHLIPGCDSSTSVFIPKTFCKKSCLTFISKCSPLVEAWISTGENISKCVDKPLRNGGNIPECAFYNRKIESLKKEGIVIGKLISVH